jgi:putative inorganic carbon (HCO3(-)) transporter
MNSSESFLGRAAFWLTGSAVVSVLFSIAVCQILLALAVAALLLSGEKLRLPPIRLPLALFILGTLLSLGLSGDVMAGRPQIRKFFVFLVLLLVYSTFRKLAEVRRLVLCWAGIGALVALRGLIQFGQKVHEASSHGRNFYEYYVGERITGFMSHWMTFGGQLMIVFLLLLAFVFFSPFARKKLLWFGLLCAAPIAGALLLGFTRSIWLAVGTAGVYLVWYWQRRFLAAIPVMLLASLWLAPGSIQTRLVSMFQPRRQVDSNQHRIVCWRTGWRMIEAHPWFGLGPEEVGLQFEHYVPSDVPRPLPRGWYGHLHNIYIHYAAERGIPTMLVLVWLLVKMLFDFLRAVRRLPPGPSDERFLLQGGIAVVMAVMIAGIFELNLGDSEVLTLFLAAVACSYAAWDRVMRKEGQVG